jgi:hypothetical protein
VNRTDEVITWSGGSVKPNRFEQWGFEIEGADQPGTLSYKATLVYANGTNDDVTVDIKAVADLGSASASAGGSTSRVNAALGIGIVALALAVIGLITATRGKRPSAPSTSSESTKAQDW